MKGPCSQKVETVVVWSEENRRLLGDPGQARAREVERMMGSVPGRGEECGTLKAWEQTEMDQPYPKSLPLSGKKSF